MKTNVKSIKINYIMNCLLTASGMIFPIISYPYVTRVLGPEGIGKVAVANSIVSYFALAAMMGVPMYGIRACAKVRDNKLQLSQTVWEIFRINLLMTFLVCCIYIVCLFVQPRFYQDKLLYGIMGTSIIFQMLGVEWLFKGLEEYTYITIRSVIFKFIAMILMFFIVRSEVNYPLYGGLTILAGVGSSICNFFRLFQIVYPYKECKSKREHLFSFKKHIKPIGVFFAMSAATTIYTNLDIVMLGAISGDVEAGYYSAAVKVKCVLVSFVTALGTVLLPRMSYYIEKHQNEQVKQLLRKAIHFVALISIPLYMLFSIFAKQTILILSGDKFLPAVIPMRIVMPTLILIGFSNIIGIQLMVPLGKEKTVLYAEVLGATVDVIFNFIFIPQYGASGAAAGTLLAEIIVLLYLLVAYRRMRNRNEIW